MPAVPAAKAAEALGELRVQRADAADQVEAAVTAGDGEGFAGIEQAVRAAVKKAIHSTSLPDGVTSDDLVDSVKLLLDRLAGDLIATQTADGYLGIYTDAQRWTGPDLWTQRATLQGLLRYYEATGSAPAGYSWIRQRRLRISSRSRTRSSRPWRAA